MLGMNFTKRPLAMFFFLLCVLESIVETISKRWLRATVCLRPLHLKAFAVYMRKPWPAPLNMFSLKCPDIFSPQPEPPRKPLARRDSVTCVNAEEVQLFQQRV